VTWPNTTCFPSNHAVVDVHKKNCEPFVLGPALAIDNTPLPWCLNTKFSSLNLWPYIDFPPVAIREVTALAHKIGNDPMEGTVFISKSSFSGTQLFEILAGFRCYIAFQLNFNSSHVFATHRHVKVDNWVCGVGCTKWRVVGCVNGGVWGRHWRGVTKSTIKDVAHCTGHVWGLRVWAERQFGSSFFQVPGFLEVSAEQVLDNIRLQGRDCR
jgi:hypothetical protein